MTVKGGQKCNNWPDYPIGVFGATGGVVGNTVIICGGRDTNYVSDECYSLTSDKATLVTHMSVQRAYAASIVLNDKTLWVTGGGNDGVNPVRLESTEYVKETGTMFGPDLPMDLYAHAMVAINSTFSVVIGGETASGSSTASTFFYDHNEGEWINGPSLMEERAYFAAGIVTDEVTDEPFLAVTGGQNSEVLNSSEILQDGEWAQGNINDTLSSGHFQNMSITLHTTYE